MALKKRAAESATARSSMHKCKHACASANAEVSVTTPSCCITNTNFAAQQSWQPDTNSSTSATSA